MSIKFLEDAEIFECNSEINQNIKDFQIWFSKKYFISFTTNGNVYVLIILIPIFF